MNYIHECATRSLPFIAELAQAGVAFFFNARRSSAAISSSLFLLELPLGATPPRSLVASLEVKLMKEKPPSALPRLPLPAGFLRDTTGRGLTPSPWGTEDMRRRGGGWRGEGEEGSPP